ncbi:MAG: dihydrofolate reductase [Hyphomicrobiales bacterium]|nr:dihydrofolate reductase [Hyphomicrobiales bacterium]MDE2016966.1 dihydrofolate reductase [Hyphomicrobiales bacterium]
MSGARVALVVACARGGIIGAGGGLPWRMPTDLKRFRALTMGKPLVVGRKTWESIGRPLPGRDMIVVTRDAAFRAEGVRVAHSLEDALALARSLAPDEIAIGGGAEIYRAALALADRAHVTRIDLDVEGDARFPDLDPVLWREVAREVPPRAAGDDAACAFVSYERAR